MKITDRVYSIDLLSNRAYLIADYKLALIDTGYPGNANRIIKFIKKIGRDESELEFIILTHHHIDHRGSARVLKHLTQAKVAAHKIDIPFIEGRRRSFREVKHIEAKFMLWAGELLFGRESVRVDIELQGNDEIFGLRVIHTPGHTKGSICLYDKVDKIIFTGDTMPLQLERIPRQNPYSYDWQAQLSSLRRLLDIDFCRFLPSDGKMVLNEAKKVVTTG
jgi:glyoxylase-like metal-dependent hydrolase (beta-lactamase superfamily II)